MPSRRRGAEANIAARRVSAGNAYVAKLAVYPNGAVTLRLSRIVANTETVLVGPVALPGITLATGQTITVRVQASGTNGTLVRARGWLGTGTEPSAWAVSTTDSTAALQAAGAIGLIGYLSSSTTDGAVTVQWRSLNGQPSS